MKKVLITLSAMLIIALGCDTILDEILEGSCIVDNECTIETESYCEAIDGVWEEGGFCVDYTVPQSEDCTVDAGESSYCITDYGSLACDTIKGILGDCEQTGCKISSLGFENYYYDIYNEETCEMADGEWLD